jgi:hypothetical protein
MPGIHDRGQRAFAIVPVTHRDASGSRCVAGKAVVIPRTQQDRFAGHLPRRRTAEFVNAYRPAGKRSEPIRCHGCRAHPSIWFRQKIMSSKRRIGSRPSDESCFFRSKTPLRRSTNSASPLGNSCVHVSYLILPAWLGCLARTPTTATPVVPRSPVSDRGTPITCAIRHANVEQQFDGVTAVAGNRCAQGPVDQERARA